jgi:hypothetical protein
VVLKITGFPPITLGVQQFVDPGKDRTMIEGLSPLGPIERATGVRRTAPRAEPPQQAPVTEHVPDGVPGRPPTEVLEALDQAQRVIAEFEAKSLSLHFSVDEATDRIRVQVKDASGNVVREIPARQALEMLSGERPVGLAFDAVG